MLVFALQANNINRVKLSSQTFCELVALTTDSGSKFQTLMHPFLNKYRSKLLLNLGIHKVLPVLLVILLRYTNTFWEPKSTRL